LLNYIAADKLEFFFQVFSGESLWVVQNFGGLNQVKNSGRGVLELPQNKDF